MNGRSELAAGEALREALRPLVAELVEVELERRLDDLAVPDWLTLEQAAPRYHSTPDALRKRAQRGHLPGAVRDGARWLVDRRVLDRALSAATLSLHNKRGPRRANVRAPGTGELTSHAR